MMNLGFPNFQPPDDDDDEPKPVKIDERWLAEFASFGVDELGSYLKKHAAFAAWLETHPQEGDAA